MKKLIPILLLALFAGVLTGKEVRIDLKNAAIVAHKRDARLAQDLQWHLNSIGGGKVAIYHSKKAAPKGKYLFLINQAPEKRTYAKEEGVYTITDKAAYFHGNERGYSHALYMFLEDNLGVRWPNRNQAVYKKRNPIIITKLEDSFKPVLNLRGIRNQGIWSRRLRNGGHDQPKYGHAFTNWWQKYGKTHPEYFALNYGRRAPTRPGRKSGDIAQTLADSKYAKIIALCVSSHAVVDRIIANWNKKSLYINICENDAPDILSCHCKNCMALDVLTPAQKKDWTHALADRYIVFANRVVAKAKKYKKDVKVSMYAYNASQDAPRKVKPDPAVVIGIVPTDFTMEGIRKYVGDWKKMGLNTFFYRPNRHYYYNHTLPTGYEKHFYNVMQYLIKQNSIGFDYDAPKMGGDKGLANPHLDLSDYILCKTMQDPTKSFDYWMDHYASAYGKAAPEVKKYFQFWREQVWEKRIEKNVSKITTAGKFYNYGRGLYWNLGKYYKASDFAASGKILAAAAKKSLTPQERAALQTLLDFHTHSTLIFNAITKKTTKDSLALIAFRQKHKINLMPWAEQYYGDVCGIKKAINFKDYDPPFVKAPRVWNFKLDPKEVGDKEKWFALGKYKSWKEMIPIGYNWEKIPGRYAYPSKSLRKILANYNGIGWYACPVRIPKEWKNREVFVYFSAVDESAWIYCNGKKAGKHLFLKSDDWTTPFAINITKLIDWNKDRQEIVVKVQDRGGAGGIWKDVFLLSKKKK